MKRLLSLFLLSFLLAEPVWAGLPLSLNFRGTTVYVTDGAGETAVPAETDTTSGTNGPPYPTSISGINMGWVSTVGMNHYNSSTTPTDKSFSGFATNENNNQGVFRIDLPNGDYTIAFAGGDYAGSFTIGTMYVEFLDDTANLFTLTTGTTAGNEFVDHNNALKSATTWSNASPRTVTITSGMLKIKVGNNSSVFTGIMTHLQIAAVAGGAAETFGFRYRRAQ